MNLSEINSVEHEVFKILESESYSVDKEEDLRGYFERLRQNVETQRVMKL